MRFLFFKKRWIFTAAKISYEEAVQRILNSGCQPLFKEHEWMGVVYKYKKVKYWFLDKNGHMFYATFDNVVVKNKILCNACSREKQTHKSRLNEIKYKKYSDLFYNEKSIRVLTPHSEYIHQNQKLSCFCEICKIEFKESLANLQKLSLHKCVRVSSGERIVWEFLEKNGISYDYQVYIQEIGLISDFEIKLKDGGLIHLEIDGDQHYSCKNQFHKNSDDFLNSQKRDKIKDDWYTKRSHKNIHIRYNHCGKHNDNILLILNDIFDGVYGECNFKSPNLQFNILDIVRLNFNSKKIIAYTLNGNFYGIYNSLLEAEQHLGVDDATISECLYGKRNVQRAGNYMFKLFTENYHLKIQPYKRTTSKPILVYLDGKFIEEVESLNAVCKKYNVPSASLSRSLNNKGQKPNSPFNFNYKHVL